METNDQQNDELDVLWGVKEIAPVIRRTERQTQYLIDTGVIPVDRHGRLITTTRTKLRMLFGASKASISPATTRQAEALPAVSSEASPPASGRSRKVKLTPRVAASVPSPSL